MTFRIRRISWCTFRCDKSFTSCRGGFEHQHRDDGREVVEVVLDGLCPLVKEQLTSTTMSLGHQLPWETHGKPMGETGRETGELWFPNQFFTTWFGSPGWNSIEPKSTLGCSPLLTVLLIARHLEDPGTNREAKDMCSSVRNSPKRSSNPHFTTPYAETMRRLISHIPLTRQLTFRRAFREVFFCFFLGGLHGRRQCRKM